MYPRNENEIRRKGAYNALKYHSVECLYALISLVDSVHSFAMAGRACALITFHDDIASHKKSLLCQPRCCGGSPITSDERARRTIGAMDFRLNIVFGCVTRATSGTTVESKGQDKKSVYNSWLHEYPA